MIALLDINVLIAILDRAHTHSGIAREWLATNRSSGWATCPLTQNGFIRIVSQRRYPGSVPVAEAVELLSRAVAAPDHHFWPDSVSLCEKHRFDFSGPLSSAALTDLYLLRLAAANGGRFVTFDRFVAADAVRSAEKRHLLVL
jgi:toxin-antitoxin system PIN domain toxin